MKHYEEYEKAGKTQIAEADFSVGAFRKLIYFAVVDAIVTLILLGFMISNILAGNYLHALFQLVLAIGLIWWNTVRGT